jgi:hypothetical protein
MSNNKHGRYIAVIFIGFSLICGLQAKASAENRYSWLAGSAAETIKTGIKPPMGYVRLLLPEGSFGAWLRNLPLHPGSPPVYLYNGRKKQNQFAHHSVINIDVGDRDLQQCADAVIRLRAEYLYSVGCHEAIAFRFTSGDLAIWNDWLKGMRPQVNNNSVSWRHLAQKDASYRNFRKYLDMVFTYAGSASLSEEMERVIDPLKVEVGNVFIQGGFPGHAVIVVDMAESDAGDRCFLLAQSYMPAQEIHILRNLESWRTPWYRARAHGMLSTPEWSFHYNDLRRFPSHPSCLIDSKDN